MLADIVRDRLLLVAVDPVHGPVLQVVGDRQPSNTGAPLPCRATAGAGVCLGRSVCRTAFSSRRLPDTRWRALAVRPVNRAGGVGAAAGLVPECQYPPNVHRDDRLRMRARRQGRRLGRCRLRSQSRTGDPRQRGGDHPAEVRLHALRPYLGPAGHVRRPLGALVQLPHPLHRVVRPRPRTQVLLHRAAQRRELLPAGRRTTDAPTNTCASPSSARPRSSSCTKPASGPTSSTRTIGRPRWCRCCCTRSTATRAWTASGSATPSTTSLTRALPVRTCCG